MKKIMKLIFIYFITLYTNYYPNSIRKKLNHFITYKSTNFIIYIYIINVKN